LVTHPHEIAQEVCKINSAQYNQAQHTPFGSDPLENLFGHKGDTPTAEALLNGTLPAQLSLDMMPETLQILHSLAQQNPWADGIATILPEDFIQSYKTAKESTLSSPLGRHIGHYMAAIRDQELSELHATMMSIPFDMGFAPTRWSKVTDIMLEKEENNPCCHCLHILALFESDLNHAKRIIIGRCLMHHMCNKHMLPAMQHGSIPGKQCISAVLMKVLSHDYLRVTKTAGAVIENDAISCYDRLVNSLVLMLLIKLGSPKSVAASIGELWDTVVHLIKTIYGISSVTYGNTAERALYGLGQGSTCGPLFWIICYWKTVTSLDPDIKTARFLSIFKEVVLELTGVSFVDDTSFMATSDYAPNPSLTDQENS
jgi:hypothetical protein